MATTTSSTALSTAAVASAALRVRTHKRRSPKLRLLPGLNAYQGLVAHNNVVAMGLPVSTEQCFSKILSSIRPNSGTKKGGALSATCNAAAEIFRIAAIMNGLVLVGVAVGFVLLRIEASLEESESDKYKCETFVVWLLLFGATICKVYSGHEKTKCAGHAAYICRSWGSFITVD